MLSNDIIFPKFIMKALTYIISALFVLMGFHLRSQDLEDRLRKHVEFLSDTLTDGRGLGTSGKILAESYIEDSFSSAGLEPWKGSYRHHFNFKEGLAWIHATNFIGIIPGSDPLLKNEFIVIGAHYDHLGYDLQNHMKTFYAGADDNASGVAALLEIAKMISLRKNNLKRSVIFIAFDAEESGLLGSKNIVNHNIIPVDSVKVMFSLDMVGMYDSHKGFDLNGIGTLHDGFLWAEKLAQSKDLKIKNHSANIEQRTDTAPFGRKGIPAIHVFTGFKSPYHKPEDKAHLLDYKGMAAISEFMTDYTLMLSQEQVISSALPYSTKSEESSLSSRFEWGITAGLSSSHHNYKDRFYDAKNALGFKGGMWVEWHMSSILSLQTQAQYDIHRSRISEGTFTRHSVFLPFNMTLSSPTKNTGVRAYLSIGPYFRHNISAEDENLQYNIPGQVLSSEWGYNWEWGMVYKKWRLGWNYQRALTDTFDKSLNLGRVRSVGSNIFVAMAL
jgi:hypothetical protein